MFTVNYFCLVSGMHFELLLLLDQYLRYVIVILLFGSRLPEKKIHIEIGEDGQRKIIMKEFTK